MQLHSTLLANKMKKTEKIFTVQFDLVIPVREAFDPKQRTLVQHEVFLLVQKQLKFAFDTEICHTQNYKIAQKCINSYTEEMDKKGELL